MSTGFRRRPSAAAAASAASTTWSRSATPISNPTLQLDPESVRRNSVALLGPATDAPLIAAVGAREGEEFLRQNALMAAAWGDRIAVTSMVLDGLHHYSAVEALADADSELAVEVRRQMTVSPSAAGSAEPVRT